MPNSPTPPSQFMPRLIVALREGYSLPNLLRDASAGLAIAIVSLPLSIAIAIAAGSTPQVGLMTLIIGGALISLLGGSRTSIGGVTGAFIALLYTIIQNFGFEGLLTATLMAGVILIVAGLLRLGLLVRYVPDPVMRGFTVGIAIVVAIAQLKDAMGLTGSALPAQIFAKISAMWQLRDSFNPTATMMTIGTILIAILLRRIAPKLPGLVIAAVLAAIIAAAFNLPVETIATRFGPLSLEWPNIALPDIGPARLLALLPSALAIAFLAGVESLLSATIADRMTGEKHSSNMEIVAQGIANLASSVLGGLPVSGALSRTAANIAAGGRTPIAGISHAIYVLVFMMFAAPLVGYLTLPSLAAILLISVWQLSQPDKLIAGWKAAGTIRRIVLVFTLGMTVFSDLILAVAGGIILGLVLKAIFGATPPPAEINAD